MRKHTRFIGATLLLAMLAAVAWWANTPPGHGPQDQPTSPSDAGGDAAPTSANQDTLGSARSDGGILRSTAEQSDSPNPATGTLRVTLVTPDSAPAGDLTEGPTASGRIWLHEAEQRAALFSAPGQAQLRTPPQPITDRGLPIQEMEWRGTVRCEKWHRIKVQLPGFGTRFAVVQPFAGEHSVQIILEPSSPSATVIVWDPDLRQPLEGISVEMAVRPRSAQIIPTALQSETTDAYGMASFRGLDPGQYIARIGGLRPDQQAPHCAGVVVRPTVGLDNPTVHLVAPPVELPVRFELHVPSDIPHASQLILAARKLDLPIGEIHPVVRRLSEGVSVHDVHLPEGLWELISIPENSFTIDCGSLPLAVSNSEDRLPEKVVVNVSQTSSTEVRLVGIPARSFPWSVHSIPMDFPTRLEPEILHLGPRRWHKDSQAIALGSQGHVAALTPRGVYLSRHAVLPTFTGDIEMVAATNLQILAPLGPLGQPVVAITGGGMNQIVPLRRQLGIQGDNAQPHWSANALHLPGPLDLQCTWPNGAVETLKVAPQHGRAIARFGQAN